MNEVTSGARDAGAVQREVRQEAVKFTGRLHALGKLGRRDMPSGEAAVFVADVENLRALAPTFNTTTTFHSGPLADAGADLLAALRGLIGLERRKLLKDKAARAWVGAAEAAIAKAEGRT